jgi:hypothetical protein
MQFSPLSRHFIPLRTKYSPQHPVLEHPQSVVYICFRLKCNLLSSHHSSSLHVSAVEGHHQVLSVYGSTALVDLWSLFQFINLYTVGRTPWRGDQPVARTLPTHRINAHRHPCLE